MVRANKLRTMNGMIYMAVQMMRTMGIQRLPADTTRRSIRTAISTTTMGPSLKWTTQPDQIIQPRKKPRLGSVITDPSIFTLFTAGVNTDRVLKNVQFDADNSEPRGPKSGAKRTGYLKNLGKADLLFLRKVEYRKRRLNSSSEEPTSGNSALVAKTIQSDMDNSEPTGLVLGSRRNGEKLTEPQLSRLF